MEPTIFVLFVLLTGTLLNMKYLALLKVNPENLRLTNLLII